MKRLVYVSLILAACGSEKPAPGPAAPPPASNLPLSVQEAKQLFPNFLSLQTQVIAATCSPNPGVCHNSNNYPDLRTPGAVLATIEAPCNVEMPDPAQGWDACERQGDMLLAGDFRTQIGWIERIGPGRWRLGLRDAATVTETRRPQIYSTDFEAVLEPLLEWNATVELVSGSREVSLVIAPEDGFILEFIDAAIGSTIGGDTNRNGVFGMEVREMKRGAMVKAGDVSGSYLWGRITGTVPGTRMPLANKPLSNAAYAAIACWIEKLPADREPRADDVIDYDNCDYAKAPLDPAVE